MTVLNNTKKILDKKGMTAYRLAQLWDKRSNYVYTLVNQEEWPAGTSLGTFLDLSRILNVPIADLLEIVSDDNG